MTAFEPGSHKPLLAQWLKRPHVARWWGDPDEALAALEEHPAATEALITVDARPVGFLCWQTPTQEELSEAGLGDLPADLVDVDILIGDPGVLGQGIAPAALRALLARLQAEGARVVGLASAAANAAALRAYKKAGFQPYRDFHEAGQDMRYLIRHIGRAG